MLEDKLLALLGCGMILTSTYLYIWKVSLWEVDFTSIDHRIKTRAIALCIGSFILGMILTADLSYRLLGYVLILDSFLATSYGLLRRDIFGISGQHRPIIVIIGLLAFVLGFMLVLV